MNETRAAELEEFIAFRATFEKLQGNSVTASALAEVIQIIRDHRQCLNPEEEF